MVNEYNYSRKDRELERKIRNLENQVEALLKLVHQHLGFQTGANNPNAPHAALSAVSRGAYTVTNGTTDRTYDADTVLVAELADIVYTLITDLQTIKILG